MMSGLPVRRRPSEVDDRWPTCASRELCLLLEDLPQLARQLRDHGSAFQIEFVEQGCYRILAFTRRGDLLDVTCTSGDPWTPSPAEGIVIADELTRMLREIVAAFLSFAAVACPEVTAHRWFREWQRSLEQLLPGDAAAL